MAKQTLTDRVSRLEEKVEGISQRFDSPPEWFQGAIDEVSNQNGGELERIRLRLDELERSSNPGTAQPSTLTPGQCANGDVILTYEDAGKLVGKTRETIRNWVAKGLIPFVRHPSGQPGVWKSEFSAAYDRMRQDGLREPE
jgi:hypothetical protein